MATAVAETDARLATILLMQLCDIFLGLDEATFQDLMRSVSIGKLKRFKLYDRVKTRVHLAKLSSETLRKATPRMWARLTERDDDFATDLAQAVLVSHLELIKGVLDFLGVPHDEGFFAKDADVSTYLQPGWQQRVWEKFHETVPPAPLLFYINHLAWETLKAEDVFTPAA